MSLMSQIRAASMYRLGESLATKFSEAADLVRRQGDLLAKAADEIERLTEEKRRIEEDSQRQALRLRKIEEFIGGSQEP